MAATVKTIAQEIKENENVAGTLFAYLTEYEDHLLGEGFSENSVLQYLGSVLRFLVWCAQSYGSYPSSLHRQNVLDFKSYLQANQKYEPATINTYISSLASFNSFLIYAKRMDSPVIFGKDRIKVQTGLMNPNDLDVAEVEKFRQDLLDKQGPRDHAIATIMAYGGLRISEVIVLELTDLCYEFDEVIVRKGKGGKYRRVAFSNKMKNAVDGYIRTRQSDSPYLFPSRQSPHISRSRVNQIFNGYSDTITPHKLRHFYCSYAQNYAGLSLSDVAQQAGHSDPRTTLKYTHSNWAQLLEKANKM